MSASGTFHRSRTAAALLAAPVLILSLLAAGCSGTPATPGKQPEAGGTGPSASPAAEAAAPGGPGTPGGAGATGGAAGEEAGGSEAPGTQRPGEGGASASGAGGTRIVVPSARERAIQKALAATEEALASSDADRILEAARALVESEALTLPEGARSASRALARFRELAPSRLAEAVPVIEKAHALVPGTAASFGALGWGYFEASNYGQAESAAASGLVLAPFDTDLLLLRAKVLVATDRWYQAQTPLEALLKAQPGNAEAMLLRATITWQYERDARAATEIVQNAFAVHPEDLRFPELQGRILYEQGQRAEARLVLASVLERDPSRLEIARLLADDAVERGAWEEAKALLARLPPPSSESELVRAHAVARGTGDFASAVALAERLDASEPTRRWAPLRARSLLEAGERDRALGVIAEALGSAKDGQVRSELYYLRATASGEPFGEEAVRDLRRALSENPTNSDAVFAMARHYFAVGQLRQAQQYARSALRDRPDDPAILELLRAVDARLNPPAAP